MSKHESSCYNEINASGAAGGRSPLKKLVSMCLEDHRNSAQAKEHQAKGLVKGIHCHMWAFIMLRCLAISLASCN